LSLFPIFICFSINFFVNFIILYGQNPPDQFSGGFGLDINVNEDGLGFKFVFIVKAMSNTNFTMEFCGTYIHVRLNPGYEISSESMHRLWTDLAGFIHNCNCRRVLAEGLMPSRRMNMAGAFISGEQISQAVSGLSMACYFQGYKADELTEFFKTVSRNRGVSIEFFSDREEACRWLGIWPCGELPAGGPGNESVPQFFS